MRKLSAYAGIHKIKMAKYSKYQNLVYRPHMLSGIVAFLRKYVQTSILKRMKKDLAKKSFRKDKLTKCISALGKNV